MSSFILNNLVVFDEKNSLLKTLESNKNQGVIKLDNLETIVITKLIKNHDTLISYEEFLQHWRSSTVSENALSRVVSVLRSKLKKLGITDKVIINTPKKGYTFVGDVSEFIEADAMLSQQADNSSNEDFNLSTTHNPSVSQLLPEKVTHPTNKPHNKINILWVVAISLIVTVNTLLVVFHNNKTDKESIAPLGNAQFVELLKDRNLKIEFNFNEVSHNIVFASKTVKDKYWHLKIANQSFENATDIKDPNKNLRKPIWLNENEIVYRSYDENTCEIRKSTIHAENSHHSSVKLFSCNPGSYASSIAKLDDKNILFSDAELGDTVSNLYIGEIETGKKKRINIKVNGGVGIYNIITTPHSPLVAVLLSNDGISSAIHLVDPRKNWEIVWRGELSATNLSIGWDGQKLSYKNNFGGLTIVQFKAGIEINRSYIPIPSNIYNISSLGNGLLFTSGSFYSKDVALIDQSRSLNPILISKGFNAESHLGKFYSKDRIIFVSNKTGLNQVWMYDINTDKAKQITQFEKDKQIKALSVDFNAYKFAIEVSGKIQLYSIDPVTWFTNETNTFSGIKPEFFKDKILYTKYDGKTTNIMYRLKGEKFVKEHHTNISGGFKVKTDGKDIYYSKLYIQGVWKYIDGNNDVLVYDALPTAYSWMIRSGELIFHNDAKEFFSYNLHSRNLNRYHKSPCPNPTDVLEEKCIMPILSTPETKLLLLKW